MRNPIVEDDRRLADDMARPDVAARPDVLWAGDLVLDRRGPRAWRGADELPLSTTELRLLEKLLRHRGELLDRDELRHHVWPDVAASRSNVLDVFISHLRRKIDKPYGVQSIETVRGGGYRMRLDGGREGHAQ